MSHFLNKQELGELEKKLNYSFYDKSLLEKALTHTSAISPAKRVEQSYQRLEFLGDRVLGLAIANLLHKRFPQSNEGELSRTLNSLVRKETCAKVAKQLNLDEFIILGESEAKSGGANKEAILGDVCEAIIGAIYRDGGFDEAHKFVEEFFAPLIDEAKLKRTDSKTALQEWAQANNLSLPKYTELSRTGPDHAPTFTIGVKIDNYEQASAKASSKKLAEQRAAYNFLIREKIWQAAKYNKNEGENE